MQRATSAADATAVTGTTTPDVIVVERLTKRYGDLTAVDDVSFTARRGEILGIVGPNGAGKTTTLECIEGLRKPTAGSIRVLDADAGSAEVKERIGVQLQANSYFDHLTLTETLELFGRFYKRSLSPARLLSRVNLDDKARTTVRKLSGGQQQRFSLAATLVNDPEVVILDEPSTGLDPQARRDLWDLARDINTDGRTILLTTHYMEEAEHLCDRVAIMDRGQIVALDSPRSLVKSLRDPDEVRFNLPGRVDINGLDSLPAVTSASLTNERRVSLRSADASETLAGLIAWARAEEIDLEGLEVASATLEDVFLALTGKAYE